MHILIVTAALPYPTTSGGALRVYGLLRGLHQAGHTLALLSFHDGAASPADTPLAEYCQHIEVLPLPARSRSARLLNLALSSTADMEKRLDSAAFRAALLRLLREHTFDLVQFEGLEVARYLEDARAAGTAARLVYDAFNAEAQLQQTMYQIDRGTPGRMAGAFYSLLQSRRLAAFEERICRSADLVIAVSSEDAALLRRHRPDGRVSIVPSGIVVEDYVTRARITGELSLERPADMERPVILPERSLVFSGKMDYRPNVDAMTWFSHHILPQIPDATLIIVGQQPHQRIQQLMQRPGIRLTGYVESVQPYLRAAEVFIAPLRMGSGTRLKILEAMACGSAIVATSLAASGLSPEARETMLIADTEVGFADAVNRLLNTPELRESLGKQATRVVRAYYDWSVIIPRLLDAYKTL
ncbi:MAG: glycosyltransferase [Anaerolineae bacterium]|nr:glycosyltransferase [Anaerolineae bacterium]